MENDNYYFIIDSSFLIAFYNEEDNQHTEALKIIDKLSDKFVLLHPYVVEEVATVLTYKSDVSTTKKFLDNVVNSENVTIPLVNIKEEIKFFLKLNKRISFTDSTLIKLSKEKNIPILTFDKQIISILKTINF
ncbi:MAG: PIN domain-containing protein [Patescibacteria group bacterium]